MIKKNDMNLDMNRELGKNAKNDFNNFFFFLIMHFLKKLWKIWENIEIKSKNI